MSTSKETRKDRSTYWVESLASLIESGVSADEILDQIDKVVEAHPSPECPGNDMGDDAKWRRLMLELPAFVFCLLRGQNNVVGYWSFFPVSKKIYDEGLIGENINKKIDIKDVQDFFLPSDYYCYFVDFFMYAYNDRFATNPKIYASFVNFLLSSAKNGYFIRKIFAHASSSYSINLCTNAGFAEVTDHKEHRMLDVDGSLIPTKIYEFDFEKGLDSKLLSLNPKLQTIYAAHYGNQVKLPASLRGLDEKIEQIELTIRSKVVATLGSDWMTVPSHIRQKVDDRIKAAAQKNAAFSVAKYNNLKANLEFFDLRELQDLLGSKAHWNSFQGRFGTKEALNLKFDQLSELRNAIRHSRSIDPYALKEGEAAILWFNTVLDN